MLQKLKYCGVFETRIIACTYMYTGSTRIIWYNELDTEHNFIKLLLARISQFLNKFCDLVVILCSNEFVNDLSIGHPKNGWYSSHTVLHRKFRVVINVHFYQIQASLLCSCLEARTKLSTRTTPAKAWRDNSMVRVCNM